MTSRLEYVCVIIIITITMFIIMNYLKYFHFNVFPSIIVLSLSCLSKLLLLCSLSLLFMSIKAWNFFNIRNDKVVVVVVILEDAILLGLQSISEGEK